MGESVLSIGIHTIKLTVMGTNSESKNFTCHVVVRVTMHVEVALEQQADPGKGMVNTAAVYLFAPGSTVEIIGKCLAKLPQIMNEADKLAGVGKLQRFQGGTGIMGHVVTVRLDCLDFFDFFVRYPDVSRKQVDKIISP